MSSRTYSRKTCAAVPEQFADESGSSPGPGSGKRAKQASPAVRQALGDDAEFLLGAASLDVAAVRRLVEHEQWAAVAATQGPAVAARLARGSDVPLTAEEAACVAAVAETAAPEDAARLLARAARSLPQGRQACCRLLEQEWAKDGPGLDTAQLLVEACSGGVRDEEEGPDWVRVLERLGSTRDGRAAVRGSGELLDVLARRLCERGEEGVLRVLVNASNECAATAARLARTQDALLGAKAVLAEPRGAAFDAVLLALALGINCCELSGKARQLAGLLRLHEAVAGLFCEASRQDLEVRA